MKRIRIVTILFLLILGLVSNGSSEETITNRQILEKLDRIDEKLNDINIRINNIDVRVARIEEGQKNSQKQIDDIRNLLYVILSGMFALVGFVLWDRRTALAPAVKKMEMLEEREGRLERILREFAEKEPKLAAIMRNITL
ncbi:MAG: hypothetical protein ABH886_00525 [Candidatus Desantisbacteria bacterium]